MIATLGQCCADGSEYYHETVVLVESLFSPGN